MLQVITAKMWDLVSFVERELRLLFILLIMHLVSFFLVLSKVSSASTIPLPGTSGVNLLLTLFCRRRMEI
jgi:hypothetical protein